MNITDIKDIAVIAGPFITPLVRTLIKPKLKQLDKWLKAKTIKQKVEDDFWDNKFEEYLIRSYQKFININVLVFPNQQINIKDIYCPLSIISMRDYKVFRLETFSKEIIDPYQRILISDNAGMGKSTLMKWIGISLIEKQLSIPILIELRKLNKGNTILDEIFHQIDPIEDVFDRELILQFLKLGNFTILLDGFDEIEFEERTSVIADIKEFVSKANNNWFILTSRPDSSLAALGDFQIFRIRPLRENESFNLIRKYDELNPNRISSKLIEEIKEKYQQVKEFLVNPFLVSLLYKSYTYNKDIPSKKSTFYEEVYCALYKHHDLTKDGFKRNKKSGLDIYDFRMVLQCLAFNTAKEAKVEYTESELVQRIRTTKSSFPGLMFKEVSFMEDLEHTVPLFAREGNSIKWAHKSVQDYFASEFISSHPDKETIINLIYHSEKENYLNILDFLYEMENNFFRKVILLDILSNFVHYCDTTYSNYIGFSKNQIRIRQAISYLINFGVYYSKKDIEFKEAEDIFRSKFPDFKITTINGSFGETSYLFKFYHFNYKFYVLNIIGKKNENLFIKLALKRPISNTYEFLGSEPQILDSKSDSVLNKKENHLKTNALILSNLLRDRHYRSIYLLDYEKSKKSLQKISKEKAQDNPLTVLDGI